MMTDLYLKGKPSAACGECRKRRSRCDQALPSCGQCTKAGRKCPGYRNTVDLMFHDESHSIARRSKIQSCDNVKSQAVDGQNYDEAVLMRLAAAAPIKLTDFVLDQPLEDLGVSYFMSTYVGDDPWVSPLYYLPKLYTQSSPSNPGLQQSITAAGLAGYAKNSRRHDIKEAATRLYVSAIRSINVAISDPTTVLQDSTLMAISMAAMFEVLVVARLSDIRNSDKHLNGALTVALLMLRQDKQTDITYKLIQSTLQCIIINSWISHKPLPANFKEVRRRFMSRPKPHLHSLHGDFLDIITDLVEFREDLNVGRFEHPTDMIERAQAVDRRFEAFAKTMPPHGRYQTFRILHQDMERLAFNGYYHMYQQRFTAHLWNNVRASRLRLHQVISRQCHDILSSSMTQNPGIWKAQQADSNAKIIEFAIDISATVPQLAGYLEQIENQRLHKDGLPLHLSTNNVHSQDSEQPHLPKMTGNGTMEYTTHFGDGPSPFRRGNNVPQGKPSTISVLYHECEEEEEEEEEEEGKEVRILKSKRPDPSLLKLQTASVYHMLFQLYSLTYISILPAPLKQWIQDRIKWIEKISDPQDLARLQDMVARQPGDGFPVENAG
ncbi:hypothetical protein ACEQ8H_006581 [Pleosporales sp. CAS-2024a]